MCVVITRKAENSFNYFEAEGGKSGRQREKETHQVRQLNPSLCNEAGK